MGLRLKIQIQVLLDQKASPGHVIQLMAFCKKLSLTEFQTPLSW